MWTNVNIYRENGALRDIFAWTILRRNFLYLNIVRLKAVSEITARQTRTSLRKHDVIIVSTIEYLSTQIELVLPTFKSWTIHYIIEYLTSGLLSNLWNTYHSTTAYFWPTLYNFVCAFCILNVWRVDYSPITDNLRFWVEIFRLRQLFSVCILNIYHRLIIQW